MLLLGAGGSASAFSPLSLSPALWLSPAGPFYSDLGTTVVTADGSAVRRWADASGNGRHADAPNDSSRPTISVSGGITSLLADGLDDYLQVASGAATYLNGTEYTFVIASRLVSTAPSTQYFVGTTASGTDTGLHIGYPGAGAGAFRLGHTGDDAAFSSAGNTSWRVHTVHKSATAGSDYRLNGSVIGSSGSPTGLLNTANPLKLFSGLGSERTNCYIAAVALFVGSMSAQNRATAETVIGSYVGLTL
jgi:hypothetical protein